jgi:DNA-binding NtrC family response regulator
MERNVRVGMNRSIHEHVHEMEKPRLVVVALSESFQDIWPKLAKDLDSELVSQAGRDPLAASASLGAVVLAAGGSETGAIEWLESHEVPEGTPVFVVGADPSRRTAVRTVTGGASDYFAFPADVELLRNAVAGALDRSRNASRRSANAAKWAKSKAFEAIIGESPALKETLERAERILGRPDTTAIIIGETGTGKELLVRALHTGSTRRQGAFVPLNCSALPPHLVESELFGHERGAFTDAHATKPGLFEIADGGTLFLDELATLPLDVQAKLLRVLEEGEVRRVGATRPHKVDVRLIAATNEAIDEMVADGRFREDLYYRLSVITLTLPPLRQRGDDVFLIARFLLDKMARRHGVPVPPLPADVTAALRAYTWPGNVRELKNALERALLLSPEGQLNVRELLPKAPTAQPSGAPLPFPAALDEISQAAARATVDFCAGNRSEAARRLGISRQRLRRLLP